MKGLLEMSHSPSSIRLAPETENRIRTLAQKSGCSQSEWKRRAITAALDQVDTTDEEAEQLADMANRLANIEKGVNQLRASGSQILKAADDFSRQLAVERAADRAVTQQVYRVALRAAYVSVKDLVSTVPAEDRDECFTQLCDEADAIYQDDGLARLEQVMRDAREELRQSIERGGAS